VKVTLLDVYNQFKKDRFKTVTLPAFELNESEENKIYKEKKLKE